MDDTSAPRCTYCGRRVQGTLHWRDLYRIDFHFLYTGEVEKERLTGEDFGEPRYRVRLLRPRMVYACVDCFARPQVQSHWESWEIPQQNRSRDDASS